MCAALPSQDYSSPTLTSVSQLDHALTPARSCPYPSSIMPLPQLDHALTPARSYTYPSSIIHLPLLIPLSINTSAPTNSTWHHPACDITTHSTSPSLSLWHHHPLEVIRIPRLFSDNCSVISVRLFRLSFLGSLEDNYRPFCWSCLLHYKQRIRACAIWYNWCVINKHAIIKPTHTIRNAAKFVITITLSATKQIL